MLHNLWSSALAMLMAMLFSLNVFAEQGDTLDEDPFETWGWRAAMLSSLALTLATNPWGADENSVSIMSSPEAVGIKTGFRWHQDDTMMQLWGMEISHYYQAAYNYWQSTEVSGQEGVVNVLEFSPVFRFNFDRGSAFSYMETSVGASLLSRSSLNDKQFSTNFQFANSLAFGGHLTARTTWSLQLQHYSNNSIRLPNNGINFYNFIVAHRY